MGKLKKAILLLESRAQNLLGFLHDGETEAAREASRQMYEATDIAIDAMREKLSRQEGCINCRKRFWYYVDYRFSPEYCPNCGKNLWEEEEDGSD